MIVLDQKHHQQAGNQRFGDRNEKKMMKDILDMLTINYHKNTQTTSHEQINNCALVHFVKIMCSVGQKET